MNDARRMRPAWILLWCCAVLSAGCSGERNAITKQGTLAAGSIRVAAEHGKIEAYPPAASDPKDRFTVIVYPRASGVPVINDIASEKTHAFTATGVAADVLVRVPAGVRALLKTTAGDIHVSDVNAPVDAQALQGNIKIQIPSYANARTHLGNVSATIGDVKWPGTLHFSSDRGDVEVWLPAIADATVNLHTDNGTVFTDFNLHGNASGTAETISGSIGSGGNRAVIVRVKSGNIRLLKLVPQM